MSAMIVISLLVIATAAAVYLYRVFAEYRIKRHWQQVLSPPEAIIAHEMGKARRSMPDVEYKQLEREVYARLGLPPP